MRLNWMLNELNWQLSAENILSRSSCSDIDEINRNGLNLLLGKVLKISPIHQPMQFGVRYYIMQQFRCSDETLFYDRNIMKFDLGIFFQLFCSHEVTCLHGVSPSKW